jgi:hypothetical protein
VLGRSPSRSTEDEVAFWRDLLISGERTGAAVCGEFYTSTAFQDWSASLSDDAFLANLYSLSFPKKGMVGREGKIV